MKFIADRESLDRALKLVFSRTRSKSKIPILSYVLLSASDGQVTLTATDLDTQSVSACPADVSRSGSTAVAADRLSHLVDGMPRGAHLNLQLDGSQIAITAGRSVYRLPVLEADDFPEMPHPTDPATFELNSSDVKRLFGEALSVIRVDGARPYLEGGHLNQPQSGSLSMSATNGLQMIRISLPSSGLLPTGVTVPKASMAEIVKLASEGDVQFAVSRNLMAVSARGCTFTTKLIEETYPKLDGVIPPLTDNFILVDREELTGALQRLEGLRNEFSAVNFTWDDHASNLSLTISGEGQGAEVISCECGLPAGHISFMPALLGPVLDVFSGETLELHVTTGSSAMRIADRNALELTTQVMPCAPRAGHD